MSLNWSIERETSEEGAAAWPEVAARRRILFWFRKKNCDIICSQNREIIEMRKYTHTVRGARTTAAAGAEAGEGHAEKVISDNNRVRNYYRLTTAGIVRLKEMQQEFQLLSQHVNHLLALAAPSALAGQSADQQGGGRQIECSGDENDCHRCSFAYRPVAGDVNRRWRRLAAILTASVSTISAGSVACSSH